MKKNKSQSSFINIGSSLLLVIFLVLTLVTFAVLSLSSARSDYTLSERLAAHKTDYYTAASTAEEITAELDSILEKCAHTSQSDLDEYHRLVQKQLESTSFSGTSVTYETTAKDVRETACLQFSIPMSESQALDVTLTLTDYTQTGTYYTIQTWKVVPTDTWEGDQTIQLLPMGE